MNSCSRTPQTEPCRATLTCANGRKRDGAVGVVHAQLQHLFNGALDFSCVGLSDHVDDVLALEVSWLCHDDTVVGLLA